MAAITAGPRPAGESGRLTAEDRQDVLQRALDAAGLAVWDCDLATGGLVASARLNELFGYPPERAVTLDELRARCHPEDRERLQGRTAEHLAGTAGHLEVEFRVLLPDGTRRWLAARGEIVRDAAGRPHRLVGVVRDASAEKRNADALRVGREHARGLVEQAAIGIEAVGLDGRLLDVNAKLCEILDCPRDALLGRDVDGLTHPDDRAAEAALLDRLLAGAVPSYSIEKRYLRQGGEPVWVRVTSSLAQGPGTAPCRISLVEDIGQRKRAEEALQASDERFRLAMRAISGMVYDWDLDSDVVFRSEGLERLIGVAPEAAEPTRGWWSERIHPDDQTRVGREISAVLASGETQYAVEYRARHADGRWVDIWDRALILRNAAGRALRVVGSTSDVTDRKETEAALRRNEALMQAIVQSSDDAIVSKTLDGIVTSWNPGAERLFGYTAEEMIGRPIIRLAAPGREDEMPGILERLKRGERIDHFETVRRRKDGRLVDISLTVSPIRDPEGRLVGASKIARDITERRRGEERQQLLMAELDHRVKNLLAVILAIVGQTRRGTATLDSFADSLEGRLRAMARMHERLARSRWDGADLGDIVADELRPYEGGRIRIDGAPVSLKPRAAQSVSLVLHELATNAAKYGALSVPEGRVEITWTSSAAGLRLSWRESGGPPVMPPRRRGFGSRLIERSIAHDLDGTTRLEFRPGGLECAIELPAGQLAEGVGRAA